MLRRKQCEVSLLLAPPQGTCCRLLTSAHLAQHLGAGVLGTLWRPHARLADFEGNNHDFQTHVALAPGPGGDLANTCICSINKMSIFSDFLRKS